MKNLIYYICNNQYKDIAQFNIERVQHLAPNVDTCCIVSNDVVFNDVKPTHTYVIDNFDYRYSAKYLICKWDKRDEYENFLYLDTDAIAIKNVQQLFDIIDSDKDKVHGVKEYDNFNSCGEYHRFDNIIYPGNPVAYNAGTIGFNKKLISIFSLFLEYIELNKTKALLDQSLFNEFFISKNLLIPSFTNLVHLYGEHSEIKGDNNGTLLNAATIAHFFGGVYQGKNVNLIKEILNRNNLI
jgi:lipopolysaccharide biosynthesis glycosyltransferase